MIIQYFGMQRVEFVTRSLQNQDNFEHPGQVACLPDRSNWTPNFNGTPCGASCSCICKLYDKLYEQRYASPVPLQRCLAGQGVRKFGSCTWQVLLTMVVEYLPQLGKHLLRAEPPLICCARRAMDNKPKIFKFQSDSLACPILLIELNWAVSKKTQDWF